MIYPHAHPYTHTYAGAQTADARGALAPSPCSAPFRLGHRQTRSLRSRASRWPRLPPALNTVAGLALPLAPAFPIPRGLARGLHSGRAHIPPVLGSLPLGASVDTLATLACLTRPQAPSRLKHGRNARTAPRSRRGQAPRTPQKSGRIRAPPRYGQARHLGLFRFSRDA